VLLWLLTWENAVRVLIPNGQIGGSGRNEDGI
jgi:hypothetical protein